MAKIYLIIFVSISCLFSAVLPLQVSVASSNTGSRQSNVNIGINLGNQAPEIAMTAVDGRILKLSSLRGKMVLIDFWASWCGPCRYENPTLVQAFNQFKDKKFKNGDGFTVFSVSLDANKNAWLMAIVKDGLTWPYHVSDLQGWSNSAAEMYAVSSIPNNYLINGEGIIIKKNLKGEALPSFLADQCQTN